MSFSLDDVVAHYSSLNPHPTIAANNSGDELFSVTNTSFATICSISSIPVMMAEFKVQIYKLLPEMAKIVGSQNIIIRLRKKEDCLEVWDIMLANLEEEQVTAVYNLFCEKKLIDKGFSLMVVTFTLPKETNPSETENLTVMMYKFVPEDQDPEEFFGYIV